MQLGSFLNPQHCTSVSRGRFQQQLQIISNGKTLLAVLKKHSLTLCLKQNVTLYRYQRTNNFFFLHDFHLKENVNKHVQNIEEMKIHKIYIIRLNICSANYFNCVIPINKYLRLSNNVFAFLFLLTLSKYPEKSKHYSIYKVTYYRFTDTCSIEKYFSSPVHNFPSNWYSLSQHPFLTLENSMLSHSERRTPLICL